MVKGRGGGRGRGGGKFSALCAAEAVGGGTKERKRQREKRRKTHDSHAPLPRLSRLLAITEHPEAQSDTDPGVGKERGAQLEDLLVGLESGTEGTGRELYAGLRSLRKGRFSHCLLPGDLRTSSSRCSKMSGDGREAR